MSDRATHDKDGQDLRALKIQHQPRCRDNAHGLRHTKIVDTALIFAVEGAENKMKQELSKHMGNSWSVRWEPPEETQTQQFGHPDEATGESWKPKVS